MRLLNRAVGAASRRLGRPELLAAVDAAARQAQREAIGITATLASALRGDGIFVDVGANRGQVLREAVRISPRARHVAFEPVPALAEQLAREFPHVDCRELALGANAEVTQFCHFRTLDGWSGLRRSARVSDAQGNPEFITVNVSTLDTELADLEPHVLKVDVEGAELAVLQGGRKLLSRARPIVIFEHVADASALYGAAPEAPWELLTELGYTIYSALGEGPFSRAAFAHAGEIVNWLAVPPARNGSGPR
jgi:FkbM family methyltransferase